MIRLKVRENKPIRLRVQSAVTVVLDSDPYEGSYEVTPQVEAQVLPTRRKTMKENLTVKSIPFFNVGNASGGSTVYIGTELE